MQLRGRAESDLRILDAGCGNGTTLTVLRSAFPRAVVSGIEYNEELRKIAEQQAGVSIHSGDLRSRASLPHGPYDVVISQRVLINVMDANDQREALQNLVHLADTNGLVIAIEAFASGLSLTNTARAELGLNPVAMPYHNLFLPDNYFDIDSITRVDLGVAEYFLSTHYFLSYVLYPALARSGGAEFKRDNMIVPFLDALLPNRGKFGANRFLTFERN